MLSSATFYDCINTMNQFIQPFLDNKMYILRNMEPLINSEILWLVNNILWWNFKETKDATLIYFW